MRLLLKTVFAGLIALFAVAANAEEPVAERERLFEALQNAPTETAARTIENAIWQSWMAAGPTEEIRSKMAAAMRARSGYELERSLELLDAIVADAPDYSEGWNQRAFTHFLMGSLDHSLEDIDRALELEPRHFGALAGKAIILMQQGRTQLSQNALREAVGIHPWLKERSMLVPEDGELTIPPGGEDI